MKSCLLGAFLLAAILCTGCGVGRMSTEEVVDKLTECKKYGLHADIYRMFGDGKVIDIQCVPQKGA